ncbi:class I SAM-dependent methyltransferase [Amycolatopsis minnesotensis]|uniref:Class I SAM-dependent methyltransferase n=1 Tax=Amycolatopsis minnesotensis TaxID=337894 RepID=A0ABP5BF68_9PSEU
MVDQAFSDPGLAEVYDSLHPWYSRDDLAFYLPLVLEASAVLDVGCGTGALLHRAREAGHSGRLCGLDPADGMLARARNRADIEWVLGDLSSVSWERAFDLVVMTGHALQVFLTDRDLAGALAKIRRALIAGGRFACETRNPAARAWEGWVPGNAVEVVTADGTTVRAAHQVQARWGDLVRFTTTFSSPKWAGPRRSESTLRFLDADSLADAFAEAGLRIDEQFGDWNRGPLTATSPEIITIARATPYPAGDI